MTTPQVGKRAHRRSRQMIVGPNPALTISLVGILTILATIALGGVETGKRNE